jgi:LCP family protein required for cell wall assembly
MTGEPDRTAGGAPIAPRVGGGRRRARHRAKRSRKHTVLLALLAVLVIVAGLTVGLGSLQVDTVAEDVDRVADPFPDEQDRPEVAEAAQEARTIFVVGVDPADVATGATRAEAALLVRLTGDRRHAQVVTFPLDAWVAEQSTTLEGAFGADGPQGVVRAVETLTDVRVDHYAELDYSGFATVIDALGGITVDVPEEYGNRGRTFAPGPQQMDGAAALAYVRDASAASRSGDAERQQRVVQALFSRIGELGAFSDLGRLAGLLDAGTGALRVDDSLADEDLVATGWEFRGVGEPEFIAAPVGSAEEEQGQPVTRLDGERAAALWGHLQADDLAAHLGEFR